MKKTFLWIFFALISGAGLGIFTFSKYENLKTENTFNEGSNIYALFYNSYNTEEEMYESVIDVERYIFLTTNAKTDVYIAVSNTKDNIKKIKKIYDNKNINTTIKTININNYEFIQNLNEYEKLLSASDDEKSLLMVQNQILSCYEKLVLSDE